MSSTNLKNGYSADVQMQLRVNGQVFRIGQLGPDFLILKDPTDHPPGRAEVTVSIDGRVKSWMVNLPQGISASEEVCTIERWRS